MLNFEKYKDDINDFVEDVFADDILCEVSEVLMHNNECNDDCETCKKNAMRWLLEEYKEPALTEKEKTYLKNVIEFVRDDITNIKKSSFTVDGINELTCISISGKNPCCGIELIKFKTTEDMPFEGMELEKAYILNELGL